MSAGADKIKPPLSAIPRDLVCAADYERYALQHLDANAWHYLDGGAADELTVRDNCAAFSRHKLAGRVMRAVPQGHTHIELFGRVHAHPIMLAPVAYQKLFHEQGELATALAADALEACMVLSTLATVKIEEMPRFQQGRLWFQLYFQKRREDSLQLLRRAEAAGCEALVVTVDAPIAGIRNREQRTGFYLPADIAAVNLPGSAGAQTAGVFSGLMQAAPTWDDVAWLATQTRLPILVKGILHPEDARLALAHGAAGIVVSNHGGRVLDTLPATLDALPAIVAAVQGRAPILLDGGVRRGSDVFKAIALGASAVMIGRPYIHALATAGALGVAHLLRTLREELEIVMALSGCATLADVGPDCLFKQV